MFVARKAAAMRPNLKHYTLETRYGPIVCDLSESVCHPLLRYGEYPHWREDEAFYRDLTPGLMALDIGANIGVTARLLASKARHVHAFEPAPRALALLRANCADLPNVTIHAVALGAASGTLRFAEREALDMSSFAKEGIEVPVSTIDALGLKPDLIKIDVEGFEPQVFAGATETLKAGPLLLFEALSERARLECERVILAANPAYRFRRIGRTDNYVARACT